VELFGLHDEIDIYARLEFELFAFGIVPTSKSLPLLRDREVVYVNLLPLRPPTPLVNTLAPARPANSLVAEVRRPGTGLPFEVVYTQKEENGSRVSSPRPSPRKGFKASRFREHMSDAGSRKSMSQSVRSPSKSWHQRDSSGTSTNIAMDPFQP
jgi:hypothetical protein